MKRFLRPFQCIHLYKSRSSPVLATCAVLRDAVFTGSACGGRYEAPCVQYLASQQQQHGLQCNCTLGLLGALSYRQGGVAAATSHGADACAPVCTCETSGLLALLARAIDCGQAGLVKSLMGLLPYKRSSELGTFRDASGMGLLHLAVRSGSMAVLATLLKNSSVTVWQVGACQTLDATRPIPRFLSSTTAKTFHW